MQETRKSIENRKRRTPRVRTLIAFSSLIMLLFCVFVAFQASKGYETAIEDGKKNAERLTAILSDQIELTFLAVDLTLRRAVEREYFNLMFGSNLPQDIENNFRLWVDETPQIAAIMMVNEKGVVEIAANKRGYENWFDYYSTMEKDPVFTQLHDASDKNFYVGKHKTQNPKHPQLIILSRKLTKLDGSFGGLIIAAVDPEFFTSFFKSVDFGSNRYMSLFLKDGTVLFAGPAEHVSDEASLKEMTAIATKEASLNPQAETRTAGDKIKIFSFKQLKNLPIYISVVIDEEDFLSGWRDARLKDISFLAIFTIFGSVLSFFALTMAKQIVRVEESEAAAILASQAKSEFLANMSHELRTPLNAIIGFSEMINAGYFGALTDKQKERIHDIHLCGTHLLQLISDILEFSKGEAGKLEMNPEETDMPEIIDECVRILNERARGKRLKVSVDVAPNFPKLMVDKRKVRQILLNLLTNAIKFTPEEGYIQVSARIDSQKNVNFWVTDTGIGIPEADIQKALSVFGQVHRNQSHEGTGLGLPLCKMFAELHGGKLVLTSKVGEGTTVRVILPPEHIIQGSNGVSKLEPMAKLS